MLNVILKKIIASSRDRESDGRDIHKIKIWDKNDELVFKAQNLESSTKVTAACFNNIGGYEHHTLD